ncbi:hypothetical protein GJ496_003157 [Pomphorhynchus laevis]|nr:hypothetical protein GJ496_003157 [Pomphorhynchus laevis]
MRKYHLNLYSGNDRVNVDFWIELDKLIKGKTVSICGDLIQIPNQEDLSYASRIITDFIHDHGIGFTALSVCKILYGIDSYEHPKVIWQTIKKYWNSMKSIPFDQLLSLADNKLQATRKINNLLFLLPVYHKYKTFLSAYKQLQ